MEATSLVPLPSSKGYEALSGPEDEPGWQKGPEKYEANAVTKCVSCGNPIMFWHCADLGCPWCAECGTNSKKSEE